MPSTTGESKEVAEYGDEVIFVACLHCKNVMVIFVPVGDERGLGGDTSGYILRHGSLIMTCCVSCSDLRSELGWTNPPMLSEDQVKRMEVFGHVKDITGMPPRGYMGLGEDAPYYTVVSIHRIMAMTRTSDVISGIRGRGKKIPRGGDDEPVFTGIPEGFLGDLDPDGEPRSK